MKVIIVLAGLFVAASAQIYRPGLPVDSYIYPPRPYSFGYVAPDYFGGSSSRQESSDGAGNVQGSYTVTDDEGHTRVVEYFADIDGFRANVRTNEPGTDNQNPADVSIESSAYTAVNPVPDVYRSSLYGPY